MIFDWTQPASPSNSAFVYRGAAAAGTAPAATNVLALRVVPGPPRIAGRTPAVPTFAPNLNIAAVPPETDGIAPPPYRQFPD